MARTTLTDREIAYLQHQPLGRIATVDQKRRPHVVPTGFVVDRERGTIQLGGRNFAITRRAADIRRNPNVALVVDDIEDPTNWTVRGVDIRGTATLHEPGESSELPKSLGANGWMEIEIRSIRSWGLE